MSQEQLFDNFMAEHTISGSSTPEGHEPVGYYVDNKGVLRAINGNLAVLSVNDVITLIPDPEPGKSSEV